MMGTGFARRTMMCVAALAVAWSSASSLRADIIAVEGRPMTVGVTAVEVRDQYRENAP